MSTAIRIHHVAIAVSDLEGSLEFWREGMGLSIQHVEEVTEQQAVVAFLPVGESEVELVRPTVEDSGLAKFLQKRGPGIHHLCIEVEDLDGFVAHLRERKVRMINPEPVVGAGGTRVAFVHPESTGGVLVELSEAKTPHAG
jgi:methylmalonyl-CoA/ethylmalonyl-CoA epimerase